MVVVGVANVQHTVPVDGFPLPYAPVHYRPHGLRIEASGVGLGVARTLRLLGTPVTLAALVGTDPAGILVRAELDRAGLRADGIVDTTATPTSVVLVDRAGARQVHTDLKGLPDATYPAERFRRLVTGARLAVITTIGFARPLLAVAQAARVPIAADIQTATGLDDAYSQPWLAAADILFCSAERLDTAPAAFAAAALERFPAQIVAVGLGADGALLAVRDRPVRHLAAVVPRGVVDTTGAGDTLFAAFLHHWCTSGNPDTAAEHAVLAAGHAVGTHGTVSHPADLGLAAPGTGRTGRVRPVAD
jgi:sugar/nucleoside kinase (ribokinase family)